MIEIKTTTYGCICGYKADAVAFENREYWEAKWAPLIYGTCPSCGKEQLAKVIDLSELSTHTTVEADDIDALTEVDRDQYGKPILVDSGKVKQELGIVDGTPAVIETPIMIEKTRELTRSEKTDKLEQAQRAVDDLATKEFDPKSV